MKKRFAQTFRKIAAWLDPKDQQDILAGLSDEDVVALNMLHGSDEYLLFLDVLDREAMLVGESMLSCNDTVRLHVLRGQVLGLRDAGSILNRIRDAAAERKKTDERSRSAVEHANDHKHAAAYGSPYWDAIRQRS